MNTLKVFSRFNIYTGIGGGGGGVDEEREIVSCIIRVSAEALRGRKRNNKLHNQSSSPTRLDQCRLF